MKRILFLGLTEELAPVVQLARAEGYEILATDRNAECYGHLIADQFFVVDGLDKQAVLKIAKEHEIDAILTRTEMLLPTVAYVSDELGLIAMSKLVAEVSVDKFAFRQYVKEHSDHINSPDFFLAEKVTDHSKVKNYPVVLKPVDYSGSAGVALINSATEFEQYFEQAIGYSRSHRIIVESYIDGPEFSVETVSQGGKTFIVAITQKSIMGRDNLVEQRHIIDARSNGTITEIQHQQIADQVLKMADLFGFDNCLGHTEIKLSPNGPTIIETAARPGGDSIAFRLVELATGINMYQNMLNLAIGKAVIVEPTVRLCSGIQFITSDNYNAVMLNLERAINSPYLVSYRIDENFDPVHQTIQSSARGGEFIFQAPTQELIEETLNFFK